MKTRAGTGVLNHGMIGASGHAAGIGRSVLFTLHCHLVRFRLVLGSEHGRGSICGVEAGEGQRLVISDR
jgi:hypothetical protein